MNQQHLDYLASPQWASRLETDLLPWIERVADLGDDVLEVGPGPGLTTNILCTRAAHVTAIEIDAPLAAALTARLAGTNVSVVQGDAAATDFGADRFSAATCFNVLHHVPTATAQDRVLIEILRVLRPGAALFATDARDQEMIRNAHHDDTFNPMPENDLVARLERLGFVDVAVEVADHELRVIARKLAS